MQYKNTNKVLKKVKCENRHWVGNGFFVHGLLRPNNKLIKLTSPFLLVDYASPIVFSKSNKIKRGVGVHPHRGFETVTLVYKGEIEHRDSSGGGGIIKPGDVQWMTAGKGIVHEEFHSKNFSKKGGFFEMVQIWINLPKSLKMVTPKYQAISKCKIPCISSEYLTTRIISGEFNNIKGLAETYTEINIFDFNAKGKGELVIKSKINNNSILLIMRGKITINNKDYDKNTLLLFENKRSNIYLHHDENFKGLFLNGSPINEKIYSYGPFVMNNKREIEESISDFKSGKMGNI